MITALRAKLEKIDRKIDKLLAGTDDLSAAEAAEFAGLKASRDRLAREIIVAEERGGRRTDADEPGSSRPTLRPAATKKERKRGFSTPREFLTSVMAAASGNVDRRLLPLYSPGTAFEGRNRLQATVGSDEQRGISDPYGGFLVPEAFSPDFLEVEPEIDPMAAYCQGIPMGSPIVRIPARTDKNHTTSVAGGITVTRRPETIAGTSSVMQMEQVTLTAQTLLGLTYATEELLMDSPQAFIVIIERGFKQQMGYQLAKERISGTGVGEFEGILNSPALVSVAKETGQAANTINLQNILNMRSRAWGYQNAIWVVNHDALPQLGQLNQAVGVAGTGMIWLPSLREDRPDMLLGRPLFFSEYAKTLGTQGDIIIFNGREYLEGTYQPLESAESIHVRFVNHERAFKMWMRNDGRGWWRSAITPVNSTKTLSPFVVLDSRS